MNREPPDTIKKILRKEVNYCCPVPDCGSPFLEWHHFDPDWATLNHHNPSGMIALCTRCHPMADQGAFSKDQLHGFKANPNPISLIKTKFPWLAENLIIRLGGCYATNWCRVMLSNVPIFEIKKNESGFASIMFILKNAENITLATMNDNNLSVKIDLINDLNITASANKIKIWSDIRKIGFECHFSRKNVQEIEAIITKDTPIMPDYVGQPIPIPNVDEFYSELSKIPKEKIMDAIEIAHKRNDAGGTMLRWEISHLVGNDGKVPFLDFVNCKFFNDDKYLEMKNGCLQTNGMHLEFCIGNTFSF